VNQRIAPAFVLGAMVTLFLFWLMQFMILNTQTGLKTSGDLHMVEFVRLKRESTLKTRKRNVPQKPPPKKRPPPPKMKLANRQQVNTRMPKIDIPNLDFPKHSARLSGSLVGGLEMGGSPAIALSSNLIPLYRVPPRYPSRAARKRVEGWVKIEFIITELGTVQDPEVVESFPSSVFNRAALRAILKWKFKPKLVSGVPVKQRAIQRLEFKMSKS